MDEHTEGKLEDEEEDQSLESEGWAVFSTDGMDFQLNLKQRVERARKEMDEEKEDDDDEEVERYFIGKSGFPSTNHGGKFKV